MEKQRVSFYSSTPFVLHGARSFAKIIPEKRSVANKFKQLFVGFQFEAIKSSSHTSFSNTCRCKRILKNELIEPAKNISQV